MTTRKTANKRYLHIFLALPIVLIFLTSACQSTQSASLKSGIKKQHANQILANSKPNKINSKSNKKSQQTNELKKIGKTYTKFGSGKSQFTIDDGSSSKSKSGVHSVVATAFSQVGTPYRFGGNSPETGFDCSGFVKWVFNQYDISLPRQSKSMMGMGTPVHRNDLRPGDLVFFGRKRVSHVGIYTGDNKYIHSPRSGKRIQESSLDDRGRGERYIAARRIINNAGVSHIDEQLKEQWVAEARETVLQNKASNATALLGKKAKKGNKTIASSNVKNSKVLAEKSSTVAKNTVKATTANKKKASVKGSAKQHKVKSGDTLYDLSKKYGVSPDALAKANNLSGKGKSNLKLGQTLVVPKKN